MKISIEQPGNESLECIDAAIKNNQTIRRSPHVGNLIFDDLNLLMGLTELGADVDLELVDSIKGNDNFSDPRRLISAQGVLALAGLNRVKSKVVGACQVNPDFVAPESGPGMGISPGDSLLSIHFDALRAALPGNIRMEISSNLYRRLGYDAAQVLLEKSADTLQRPMRYVTEQGKALEITTDAQVNGIFGFGSQPLEGALIPVEAMIAAEIILAAQETQGSDTTLVHIGGKDMARYTAEPEVVGAVNTIADKTAAELGKFGSTLVRYLVPTRPELLANPAFPQPLLGMNITSQYDMLG